MRPSIVDGIWQKTLFHIHFLNFDGRHISAYPRPSHEGLLPSALYSLILIFSVMYPVAIGLMIQPERTLEDGNSVDDRLYTDVPDEISQSTTWTQEESPYYANSSVSMAQGETLTIEQGVVVYMGIGASLDIRGATLDVRGTAEEPVTFAPRPDLGSESTWDGIFVSTELGQEDHSASVSLENAVIEGAFRGIDANPDDFGSPTLSVTVHNSVFSNNSLWNQSFRRCIDFGTKLILHR